MNGCVGGDGIIRQTPTFGRCAATGRARRSGSSANCYLETIGSRNCHGSRSRMARTPRESISALQAIAQRGFGRHCARDVRLEMVTVGVERAGPLLAFQKGEWVGGQPRQPGSRLFYPGLSTPIRAIRRSRRTRIRAIRRGRRLSGVGVWRRKYWRLRCLFKNLAKGLGGDPKSSIRFTSFPIWTRLVRSWAASRHGAR